MNHMEKAKRQGGNAWKLWSKRFAVLVLVAWCTMGYARPPKQGDVVAVERAGAREAVRMADKRWNSNDGNGASAASWSPTGVPGIGDNVIFDGLSQQDLISWSGGTASLRSIVTFSSYGGDIGSSGNWIAVDSFNTVVGGSGQAFIHSQNNSSRIFMRSQLSGALDWKNDVLAPGRLILTSGIVQARNSTVATEFIVGAESSVPAELFVASGTAGCTTFILDNGYVETPIPLGSSLSVVSGGELFYTSEGSTTWVTIFILGGYVRWQADADITTCYLLGGTLDMSEDFRAKTIGTLVIGPGANFIDHGNIVTTTRYDLRDPHAIFPP